MAAHIPGHYQVRQEARATFVPSLVILVFGGPQESAFLCGAPGILWLSPASQEPWIWNLLNIWPPTGLLGSSPECRIRSER